MKNIILFIGISLFGFLPMESFSQTRTIEFFVDGVCGMCEERIEKAVMAVPHVKSADWDLDTRMLTVIVKKADIEEKTLHRAVALAGHDTKRMRAPDGVYNNLDGCCKYRDPNMVAMHHNSGKTVEVFVDGVCEMCKIRIEKAVRDVPGLVVSEWDVDTRQLTFFTKEEDFDENLVHQAVAAAGHDTKTHKAAEEVYNKLHDCCKYRDVEVIAAHRPIVPTKPTSVHGQIKVEENGKTEPLPGVNMYWAGQKELAVTDDKGRFTLERPEGANQLIASYVGFYADTITLDNETNVNLTLTPGTTLETVNVTYERKSIEVSFLEPILTQNIGRKELLKAACCTLAESFETNPAVDVAFTDAVTGAQQIEMLGLAGPYVQITRENLPDIRGLSSIYGLVFLPGPWIESIQLAKGPGSVINGFESMTGQINVELKKPEEGERFYFNLYGNQGSRMEANANARFQVGEKWHTGLLLSGNWQPAENDRNEDGFLDMPTGTEWTVVNRWKYRSGDGLNGQFGFKATQFDKTSGQINVQSNAKWEARMQTQRLEGWVKIGKVFERRPGASIGLQLNASLHDQDAAFGNTRYDAEQRSFYANLIYREQLGDPAHLLNSGLSFQYDQFDEGLAEGTFSRNEAVPGAFVEYTYQPNEQFTAVAGLRGDHHKQFGFFLTPRLHLRYAITDKSVLRFSAGQGRRTANIIAENIGMLASSRAIIFDSENGDTPYGLDQEVAWNFGLNLRQTLVLHDRELILTLDGYHTRFEQQVVVDYDQSPREVRFYNLDGNSYSNTFQAQVDYAIIKNLDLRMAYRFNDVRTDYQQGRLDRPFVARHRAFVNLGYNMDDGWAFDLTVNWQGNKRIPSTADNPEIYQRRDRSPDFVVTNMQVSKQWWDRFDLYVGVENLFNFQQSDPIIAADDPFGPYFDSSLVWGPIFGRMVYAGLRLTIE